MSNKYSVLVLSPNMGTRMALSWIFKEGGYDIQEKKVGDANNMLSILISEFKNHLIKKKSKEEETLIVLNCRNIHEYRMVLEPLSKKIMKNRIQWAMEGITFTREDLNKFFDFCVVTHFVMGADLIYQIENNPDVQTIIGDMNTDELLCCTNLFCDVGISLPVYFEKELQPSADDIHEYNHALQKGKQEAMKSAAQGNVSKDDITKIINEHLDNCTLVQKSSDMKERILADIETFLNDKENWKEISHKRVDAVASADIFKQYLALKDKAIIFKRKRQYNEMEKTLKKSIELLEGTGERGKSTLFNTYIELSKGQIHRKKYISAQKNASSAKKIRQEAPSPHRLMGESHMGQATEALRKGNTKEAAAFFNTASGYFFSSQKLAAGVHTEEAIDNEIEMATAVSFFGDCIRWEAKKNPKAAELLKENESFQSIVKMSEALKAKHRAAIEAKIKEEIYQEEVDKNLDKARKFSFITTDLILEKKHGPAKVMYEKAAQFDDLTAFRTISQKAKDFRIKGEAQKAHDLYSWLAEEDKNEADFQNINAARCCILLGDKAMAVKHLENALSINKDVIQEAIELDPDFKKSDVMKLYEEKWEQKTQSNKSS